MDNKKAVKKKRDIGVTFLICCVPFLGILFIYAAKKIINYGYKEGVFDYATYKINKDKLNKILNFNLNFSLFLGIIILLILFFYS